MTRPEPRAYSEPGRRKQPGEYPACWREYQTGARMNDADSRVGGGLGGGFPVVHDPGEERLPSRCGLIDGLSAGVCVPADGRAGYQGLRWRGQLGESDGQRAGPEHPAGPDLGLVPRRPAMVRDTRSGEVDAGAEPVQLYWTGR